MNTKKPIISEVPNLQRCEQNHLRVPLVPVNWGHGRPWGGALAHLLNFFPEDEFSLAIPKDQEVGTKEEQKGYDPKKIYFVQGKRYFLRHRFWKNFLKQRAEILKKKYESIKMPSVIAIIGVPMDIGVGYRHGTRFGPSAIRKVSAQFGSGVEGGFDISEVDKKIVDLGDIEIHPYLLSGEIFTDDILYEVRQSYRDDGNVPPLGLGNIERIRYTLDWILGKKPEPDKTKNDDMEYVVIPDDDPALWKGNVFPVILGGDHSITLPCVQAVTDVYGKEDLGVIYFDAHPDYLEKRSGLKITHASQARRVAEVIKPENIFHVGSSYIDRDELEGFKEDGINFWPMGHLANKRADDFSKELCNALKERNIKHIYISFDIDVLDAGLVPGTGVPAPGGMETRYLVDIIQNLGDFIEKSGMKLIAFDLVEVAPDWDVGNVTALAAVKIILEALGAYFISEKVPHPSY